MGGADEATSGGIVTEELPGPLGLAAIRAFVYAFPPFYMHPLKPLYALFEQRRAGVGAAKGHPCSYLQAYAHFAPDHQKASTIAGHIFPCLPLQLVGNFALLAELDSLAFGGVPVLLRATVLAWIAALACAAWEGGPPLVPELALAALFVVVASCEDIFGTLRDDWRWCVWALPTFECGLYILSRRRRWKGAGGTDSESPAVEERRSSAALCAKMVGASTLRLLLVHLCGGAGSATPWAPSTEAALGAGALTMTFLLATSQNPFGAAGRPLTPFHAAIFSPFIALVTGRRVFFLYGLGYFATLLQGCIHAACDEPPSLPQLDGPLRELAHCVWFPGLLLQRTAEAVCVSGAAGTERSSAGKTD